MIELYFKLRILLPIIVFLSILFYLIILIIKHSIDIKFKKNCFNCKDYKLHDVASFGNSCRYKCTLKKRYYRHNFNDRTKLTKCKEFERE